MGWRYRRSVKLLPGVRINTGSRGVSSFSFGGRGMTVNVSKRGTKTTYSLPGTVVSYQTRTTASRVLSAQLGSVTPVNVSQSSPAKTKAVRIYTLVGAAAVATFLFLREGSLPSTELAPASQTQNTSATPQRAQDVVGLSAVIPPATAAPTPHGQIEKPAIKGRAATTTTVANARTHPSRTASIAAVLDKGTTVWIIAADGSWERVTDQSGNVLGWIHETILH